MNHCCLSELFELIAIPPHASRISLILVIFSIKLYARDVTVVLVLCGDVLCGEAEFCQGST